MSKHIQSFVSTTHLVKVVWVKEWEEYVCKLYKSNGVVLKHVAKADYHTDCKQDALGTARVMLRDAV